MLLLHDLLFALLGFAVCLVFTWLFVVVLLVVCCEFSVGYVFVPVLDLPICLRGLFVVDDLCVACGLGLWLLVLLFCVVDNYFG